MKRSGGEKEEQVLHYLTCTTGGSHKFYEISTSTSGEKVFCRHGRIGSSGVTTCKNFNSCAEAEAFIAKTLQEKDKKGYVQDNKANNEDVQPPKKKSKNAANVDIDDEKVDINLEKENQSITNAKRYTVDDVAIKMLQRKLKNLSDSDINIVTEGDDAEPYSAHLFMEAATKTRFYVIQLLQHGKSYFLFSRWGDLGEEGFTELSGPMDNFADAKKAFEHKFKIKTSNNWGGRERFIPERFHFCLGWAGFAGSDDTADWSIAPSASTPAPPSHPPKSGDGKQSNVGLAASHIPKDEIANSLIYLEFCEGNSDKFYELKQVETSVKIRYGRRGTPGVTSTKSFSNEDEAKAFMNKTASSKLNKGYHHAAPCTDNEIEAQGNAERESSGDQAKDLENGIKIYVQGSSKLPYTLRKFNGGYSCTCLGWRGQIKIRGIQAASCKHLKMIRGEEAEAERCHLNTGIVANPSSKSNKNASITSRISLAQKWKPSIDPTGYVMSEKLDGMRAYWCGEKLWTRSGIPIIAPQWFIDGLPNIELDGELFLGRKMFDECMSITRRTDASEEWKRIKYIIFDAPKAVGGIRDRLKAAIEALEGSDSRNEYAMVHPHTLCESVDHLLNELANVEKLGGEGLMLRQANAKHRGGRTSDLLKVKTFHDDEAIVTDYEAGKGKYDGMVGSLVCRTRLGAAFKVGSGLIDSQRSYNSPTLPPIGSVITYQYFELTKDGIPRFPTFLRIRPDVDASDFSV